MTSLFISVTCRYLEAKFKYLKISFGQYIFLGKMPEDPLNFGVVAKRPPELLFWPIYSLNFT